MLHCWAGSERKRMDVCKLRDRGSWSTIRARRDDRDGLYGLTRQLALDGEQVRGLVESQFGNCGVSKLT